MPKLYLRFALFISLLTVTAQPAAQADDSPPAEPQAVSAPVLKWQRGGCFAS